MERLIHSDYMVRLELSYEEASNLYDAFHYYGKCDTVQSAEDMILSDEPIPLINHWVNFDEFLTVWDAFYRMSRNTPRIAFAKMILECRFPESMPLTKAQEEMLLNKNEFQKQACFLLSFFDSMSDYFEYEITLMENGYTHWHHKAG